MYVYVKEKEREREREREYINEISKLEHDIHDRA